ncbi:SseB family protein [Nesterenkonia populi]
MAENDSAKELPAHIANLLDRQHRSADGRPADSAGIPWQHRDLSGEGNPLHTFDGDDGLAAPAVAQARSALIDGVADEAEFVNALAGQRLFAPVIAAGHGDAEHGDKEADISLVTLTASDGRSAMPIFTSVEALTAWHPQARPVAAETERVFLAALAEGAELVVLDPGAAGPEADSAPELTFVIRRPAVEALAQGTAWTPAYQDQELAAALHELVETAPGVAQLVIQPGPGTITRTPSGRTVLGGGTGPELRIGVVMDEGTDDVARRLALAAVSSGLEEVPLLRRRADSAEVVPAEAV